MNGKTTWIIGGNSDCDLVVDLPSVSGHHCRLSQRPDGSFALDDLGSTNGTYVNGRRIQTETAVIREDAITLGLTVPMPWPPVPVSPPAIQAGEKIWRVGRDPDNDYVIDSPEVSGHHARVVIAADGQLGYVDDLGSTNGTSVGSPGQVRARSVITPRDVVYFGPVPVAAESFFGPLDIGTRAASTDFHLRGPVTIVGRDPGCDCVFDFPVVSGRHARFARGAGGAVSVDDLGSSNGTYVNGRRIETTTTVVSGDLIGLGSFVIRLVVGPTEADAVVISLPEPAQPALAHAPASPAAVPFAYVVAAGFGLGVQSLVLAGLIYAIGLVSNASGLFGLCLASVWIGLTAAFFERLQDAASTNPGATDLADLTRSFVRTGIVAALCSVVLLGLVPVYIPTASSWPAAWAVLGLSVLIGAALGLALVGVSGRRAVGIPAAVGLIVVMALLCVPLRPLPSLGPVGRLAASALPTRWSFEALSLLSAGEKADDPAADPVEAFFPADTDRSGFAACATALLAMLGGLVYADAVIALTRAPRVGPASR